LIDQWQLLQKGIRIHPQIFFTLASSSSVLTLSVCLDRQSENITKTDFLKLHLQSISTVHNCHLIWLCLGNIEGSGNETTHHV